jgi:hypothetical protein
MRCSSSSTIQHYEIDAVVLRLRSSLDVTIVGSLGEVLFIFGQLTSSHRRRSILKISRFKNCGALLTRCSSSSAVEDYRIDAGVSDHHWIQQSWRFLCQVHFVFGYPTSWHRCWSNMKITRSNNRGDLLAGCSSPSAVVHHRIDAGVF